MLQYQFPYENCFNKRFFIVNCLSFIQSHHLFKFQYDQVVTYENIISLAINITQRVNLFKWLNHGERNTVKTIWQRNCGLGDAKQYGGRPQQTLSPKMNILLSSACLLLSIQRQFKIRKIGVTKQVTECTFGIFKSSLQLTVFSQCNDRAVSSKICASFQRENVIFPAFTFYERHDISTNESYR